MLNKYLRVIATVFALIGIAAGSLSCDQPLGQLPWEVQEVQNASQPEPISSPPPNPDWLLPDLKALPPGKMQIYINRDSGERELRFETSVINIGDGPLEMKGEFDAQSNMTRAIQYIDTKQDSVEQIVAGLFIFHPEHDHWHFEDFVETELFSLNSEGTPDRLIAITNKISFCIFDYTRLPDPPDNAPLRAVYRGCNPEIQGLSVGWADTYDWDLPGQQINIEGLPDGRYLFHVIADPLGRIMETNDDNNSSLGYVEIEGMEIRVIPGP